MANPDSEGMESLSMLSEMGEICGHVLHCIIHLSERRTGTEGQPAASHVRMSTRALLPLSIATH